MIDPVALLLQPGRHAANAVEGRARILLIEQAHQQQVLVIIGLWLIIEATARQAEQLTLAAQAEFSMADFDQLPLLISRADQLFF